MCPVPKNQKALSCRQDTQGSGWVHLEAEGWACGGGEGRQELLLYFHMKEQAGQCKQAWGWLAGVILAGSEAQRLFPVTWCLVLG